MNNGAKEQQDIIDLVAKTQFDPLLYAKIAYPWGSDALKGSDGPRIWQQKILDNIGQHLRNPQKRFTPIQIAVASGHGPGKSALVSMIIDWAMKSPGTKVVVTASTDKQLKTKTWPEVEKFQRLSLAKDWFKVTATSVVSADPEYERTWRADAIPWNEEEPEAFAGLHNQGKRIVLIFDEASSIADKIWEVAEGALTDANTEIIWLAFGNPTRNSGRFRECFGKHKHRWITYQVNSQEVEGINKEQIESWIQDYGYDSDFVRVRVRGEFPRAGSTQFIGGDLIEAARKRQPSAHLKDPRTMAVDVARYGEDESVISFKVGRDAASHPWKVVRNVDTMTLAAMIVDEAAHFKPDAIFVDEGGVGGGVIDRLNMLRQPVIGIQFGSRPDRSSEGEAQQVRYANKAAEMWGAMREWLKGGMIPDDPDLCSQLSDRQYGYVLRDGQDAIMLEKKSDMKKRGLASCDRADSLCLHFAYSVVPSDHTSVIRPGGANHQVNYDPLGRDAARGK